jgi:hypothetical protein
MIARNIEHSAKYRNFRETTSLLISALQISAKSIAHVLHFDSKRGWGGGGIPLLA